MTPKQIAPADTQLACTSERSRPARKREQSMGVNDEVPSAPLKEREIARSFRRDNWWPGVGEG